MCIKRQAGVSLIEAVMFIVVVSVALVVVLKAFDLANVGSADPVLRRQSVTIAQALLDEINSKPFGSAATDATADGYTAGPVTKATRANADDVDDYHGLNMNGITTLSNVDIPGLQNYQASVTVVAAAFGKLPTPVGDPDAYKVPVADGKLITVTVTDPANNAVVLNSYRANF